MASDERKKEIYTYDAPWQVYSMNWSCRAGDKYKFRFAVGSFIEEYCNQVMLIKLDEDKADFTEIGTFDHPYPATKIQWAPEAHTGKDLLATTGDYLRLWNVRDDGRIKLEALFNNNKTSDFCAPLTAFDWNSSAPDVIGTASVDTTVTIWDVKTQRAQTQLIAHDKEVYDISFTKGKDIFATVGADGSVRMFDLRSLDHSTIMYESPNLEPLLRIEWNKMDTNYLATVTLDSATTVILDIRMPSLACAKLGGHGASVNGVAWAPHSACHICTASDDCQALIWDLRPMPKPIDDPILAYTAAGEINQLQWSSTLPDWVSICYDSSLQVLRV